MLELSIVKLIEMTIEDYNRDYWSDYVNDEEDICEPVVQFLAESHFFEEVRQKQMDE